MVLNGTRSLLLVPVVPVTFGPIWPWFRTSRQQFLHEPTAGRGPVFADNLGHPRWLRTSTVIVFSWRYSANFSACCRIPPHTSQK